MKLMWSFILFVPLISWGQEQISQSFMPSSATTLYKHPEINGMQWTEGLSFREVQNKAKRENKFIFLDCYATWCGPCKDMDKNVFVHESIVDFFNQYFICVKLQMDKTENDNDRIKRMYEDVAVIKKKYKVDAYPNFIFLSPNSTLLQQEEGFKKVNELLAIGKEVIRPGKAYENPYEEYDRLIADYKQGIIHYDRLVNMLNVARKFDTSRVKELAKLYNDYVDKLNVSERYNKENVEFWASYVLGSNSRVFQYFFKDSKQIDLVMNRKGYAATVVDKTIYHEIIVPFFVEQNKNKDIPMTGMYLSGSQLKIDSSNAEWKKLNKSISDRFGKDIARRNLLEAKKEWYMRHWNYPKYCEVVLDQIRIYTPDFKKNVNATSSFNDAAWSAFKNVKKKAVLKNYIKRMRDLVKYYPGRGFLLDTYANLLYKVGRQTEAIFWEKKAVLTGDLEVEMFKKALEQMQRGEPTYGVIPLY